MKTLILVVALLGSVVSFASNENSMLKACIEDCVAYTEPGWELRACLETCKTKYEKQNALKPLYCNTDEEDCDRDGGDDDSPWY